MTFSGSARIALSAACIFAGAFATAEADPLTVTDVTGREIKLEKPAQRVIVLPVPWASTVVAMDGGTDKLIAMHPEAKLAMEEGILGTFFPGTRNIPTDIIAGGESRGFIPNVEAIAALRPDLVIQWGGRKDDVVTPLTNAGITTAAIVYGKEDLARKNMTLIGTAMGLYGQACHAAEVAGRHDQGHRRRARGAQAGRKAQGRLFLLYHAGLPGRGRGLLHGLGDRAGRRHECLDRPRRRLGHGQHRADRRLGPRCHPARQFRARAQRQPDL